MTLCVKVYEPKRLWPDVEFDQTVDIVKRWLRVIVETVEPDSWDFYGGPGAIEIGRQRARVNPAPGDPLDVFYYVVRQTPANHNVIEGLLRSIDPTCVVQNVNCT